MVSLDNSKSLDVENSLNFEKSLDDFLFAIHRDPLINP